MMRRFFKSSSARVGGALVLLLLVIVYLMPRVDPYTREIALSDGDLAQRLQPPDCAIGWLRFQQGVDNWEGPGPEPKSILEFPCNHPFGTDKNGRDLTRRVMHGIGVSLVVSVISVSISLLLGGTIGLIAGYLGGKTDSILMRLMDIMLAFPTLLLAIAIVAMRGPGLENAMLAIGIVSIPTYARLARSMAISLREQDFIMAARSIGASEGTVLRKHVLPNSLAPLIVQSTLGLGTAVIETAALGFLGLGQQPPFPELGEMLAESREVMTSGMWWVMAFPGVTVMIIVLSFNLLGDALRDTLDPKLRGQ
ncbi:MAG: ABC transporter permease [Anaerolineae bacterium]|nr:ABC transporter permease [Anaerolineae bacterium]